MVAVIVNDMLLLSWIEYLLRTRIVTMIHAVHTHTHK